MPLASRLARIIGALAATALLCACSAVKLGYNNIDDVAYWWMDGYVDFTDAQAPRMREDLRRIHRWHREQELPRYGAILQRMEQLAAGDVTAQQACALFGEVRTRLEALSERAEPAVVTTALSLEPAQLAHIDRKYRRNNAEYREKWLQLPPTQLLDKRLEQLVERSEMVYGKLEEPQRAVLRRELERSVFDAGKNLAERERRQQDALRTLKALAGQPVSFADARAQLRGYLDRVQNPPDAAVRSYQQALVDESCRTFAAAHNSTTPAQRDAAVRRLRAYQRDLVELAGRR